MATHRCSLFALLLFTGCTPGGYEVQVVVKEQVATVVELSWATDEPGYSWVEFGLDDEEARTTPSYVEPSLDHLHTLLGLPPYQEIWYRAVTELGDEVVTVEGRVTTGGLPAELPELTVTVHQPELMAPERYVLGTMLGEGQGNSGVYALDRDGNWLWYHQDPPGSIVVEITVAEGGFVYNRFGHDPSVDESVLRRVSFDGANEEQLDTPLGHHSFTEFPDGSLAWIAIDPRDWWSDEEQADVPVVGDAVVLRTPEGEQRTLFSTWDWVEPERTSLWDEAFYPQGADWTHGNGLHYDPERALLVLSLRNINTVLELAMDEARSEAWPLRQYGIEGDAQFVEDDQLFEASREEAFHLQHDPTFTSDGTLLLTTILEARTQVAEYTVEEDGQKLRLIRTHGAEEELFASAMGMARELPNGNWLVSFGTSGLVQEVTPDGQVAWELRASAGCSLGDVQLFDGFYAP